MLAAGGSTRRLQMTEDETQTDRIVQALNALTLAILSVRREMAAGPVDTTRETFLRDEEQFSRAMEQSARDMLEFGHVPDLKPNKPKWGEPARPRGGFVVDFPDKAVV
jgi:hypothetical protein